MTLRVYTDDNVRPEPWMTQAECATTDPEIFFSEAGDWRGTRRALDVCATCDVATQCLEYALRTKQRDGVWGGTDAKRRRRLLRSRT